MNYSTSSSWKASKSLAVASLFLVDNGFVVARPDSEDTPADLVVQTADSKWLPVQVKTAYMDGSTWVANTCRTNPTGREPYGPEEVYYFVIVVPDVGLVWLLHEELQGRNRIRPMSDEFALMRYKFPGGVE